MITVPLVRQSLSLGRKVVRFEPETLAYAATHTMTGAEVATLDAEIKSIKSGTPLTLSSLTLNLSLDGKFITRVAAAGVPFDLNRYSGIEGVVISVAATGTPAVTAVYSGVSAGSGETLDTNPFATFDFTSGWNTLTGAAIVDSNSYSGTVTTGITKAGVFTAGALYRAEWAGSTASAEASLRSSDGTVTKSTFLAGFGIGYSTPPAGGTYLYLRNSTTGQTDVSALAVQKVLTPDATGLTASTLTNGGINANSASYAITVSKP